MYIALYVTADAQEETRYSKPLRARDIINERLHRGHDSLTHERTNSIATFLLTENRIAPRVRGMK